jgi:poly(glycerol-phosphate) alpha-glucosyltransferase
MYFFYDDNISFKESGIEHAEIKRLRLFNVNADVKMSF